MGIKTMWDTLKSAGLTDEGASAVLGNLKAESLLKSNNLQDSYENRLGMTDDQYVTAVDNGTYSASSFQKDQAGFGLAQWTFWERKANLLSYAKSCGVSIADETMQINFLLKELIGYPSLLNDLKESNDLYDLTNRFCREFERPAENNVTLRYRYAQDIYDNHSDPVSESTGTDSDEASFQSTNVPMPILFRGCKGYPVKRLQELINTYGYELTVDMDFGYMTDSAFREVQAMLGLDADGICGRQSWSKMVWG